MERVVKKVYFPALSVPKLIRVAAYARVSSGKVDMLHSLSAQVSFYSDYIQKHKGWIYVGVYADEALTGTKDNRKEFCRLLGDCRNGKIDLVVTKSISRFARNTVTLLETVRELKALGIDVFFEEQNIHTLSNDGELMLSILASYAQEESLSVSENCKWRIRKNFKEGIPTFFRIYGYRFVNSKLELVPEEAEIVRMIFADYLLGMGKNAIVRKLNSLCIKTYNGGRWSDSTIADMLRNEKYTGNLLLQKSYVKDHLTKTQVDNNGELPMYSVSDTHEPIIDTKTFEMVRKELKARADKYCNNKANGNSYPFTGKLRCGICNSIFRRRASSAGTKYKRYIWMCPTFNKQGKAYCRSKQIPETILFDISAEVLGIDQFDENIFESMVDYIDVPLNNILIFHLKGGTEITRTWENNSRRESWNGASRQKAREKALNKGGFYSERS